MVYHLIATLPAGKSRSITNKSEEEVLSYVISFISTGTITAKWGAKPQTYQALELRIYQTKVNWSSKSGVQFETFIKNNKNCFNKFRLKAEEILGKNKHRVFIIMPIQGKKNGSQNEQRIFREYDSRYEAIMETLIIENCVAIRIDKEYAIEQLVARIKYEIKNSLFVIADLTDERPSCYFEAGYAEALNIPIIYIASEDSIIDPSMKTKIHFDIHMNVNLFSNNEEMKQKIKSTIDNNRTTLFNRCSGDLLVK